MTHCVACGIHYGHGELICPHGLVDGIASFGQVDLLLDRFDVTRDGGFVQDLKRDDDVSLKVDLSKRE